jgi:protein TonB
MPRAFLESLIESGARRKRARRASVMPLSIVLHAGALSALLVLPLLAQEGLPPVPAPPTTGPIVPYVHVVTPRRPRPASPPRATGTRAPAAARRPAEATFLAPLAPPPAIEPDPEADFFDDLISSVGSVPGPGGFGPGPGTGSGHGGPGVGSGQPDGAPLRVGGEIRPPRKVHHVDPVYPPVAVSARVEGAVVLQCTISTEGRVEGVEVLDSPPFLADAAVRAVSQWRFEPTRLNGQPVAVVMTVTVTFILR